MATSAKLPPTRARSRLRGAAVVVAVVVSAAVLVPTAPAGAQTAVRNECFVAASFQTFLKRAPTSSETQSWAIVLSNGASRSVTPRLLANSDEWLSVEVTALYDQALDRGPDSGGLAYWVGELRRGVLVNRVGAQVYGSPEFYERAGGTDRGFVEDLYTRILGRPADAGGVAHWEREIGRIGRGAVAASFFASVESRRGRVAGLYERILDRAPDPAGHTYWADRLRRENDVELAVLLASSLEFADNAQQGCVASDRARTLDLVNASRAAHSRTRLGLQPDAHTKAQAWAERLARENRLYHSNLSDGIGVQWCSLSENVGYSTSVETVHQAYMDSPGHRDNIVSTLPNGVGIGVAVNGGQVFVVHVFIRTC